MIASLLQMYKSDMLIIVCMTTNKELMSKTYLLCWEKYNKVNRIVGLLNKNNILDNQ